MAYCKDCLFWTGDPGSISGRENGWRECMNPKLGDYMLPLAEGGDMWGKGSDIETSPEFGCIFFVIYKTTKRESNEIDDGTNYDIDPLYE